MEKSSLNNELFGATNLFNSLTKGFRDGIELKNHSRKLKSYKNCFIAHKGVSFLFNLLKSKNEFNSKIQHRDQVINLMDIFLRWGIIIKIYPSTNQSKFQDNKDLYILGPDEEKEIQSSYEHIRSNISKSTNDLLTNNIDKSIRPNRSSLYRSFRSSTYDQLNQIQVSIKKTTSTIIKSTNHNMTKLANHTINKFNNRSGNNLIKKLNSNLIKSSNSSIQRSTSVLAKKTNAPNFNCKITRSMSIQQEKENLIANKKFERNYRGQMNRNHINSSLNNNFLLNNASINSLPTSNTNQMIIPKRNLSSSLNIPSNNQKVSLNPMDINQGLSLKVIETEGNNLIRFLTKLSDGLKKMPLKPVNKTNCNPLTSINENSQIILSRDHVQYKPIIIPNIQNLQSIKPPHAINHQSNLNYGNNRFNRTCLSNPISSTCYNTLV